MFPCGIAVGVMILWAFGLYRTTEVSEESNLDENLETIHALQNANERLTAEINSMNERGLQSSTLSLRNRVSQLAAEISTFFVSQVASHPAINSSRPDYEEQLRRQDEDQRKMISLFSDQYMERLISIRSELEENGFRDAEFDKLVQDVLDAPPFADSKIKPIADRLSAVAKKLPNN